MLANILIPQHPPHWLALPFIILLLMIATGPMLYATLWHKHYAKVSILLASLVIGYYVLVLHNYVAPIATLVEYIQFIALIGALYTAAGGILIKLHSKATPIVNVGLLVIGALLSNFIGTTGASMLLIRPYIRLNQERIQPYHIIFFIFMISNVGGALTPIGDPPLFLGFLKGVPFFWTLQYNFLPWLLAILALSFIFFWIDTKHAKGVTSYPAPTARGPMLVIAGKRNLVWLLLMILAVFVDPNLFTWVPAIHYHGHDFSFIRELILISLAYLAYRYAHPTALQENAFSWAPLQEVMVLFIGIFSTMMPALFMISSWAQSASSNLITPTSLYWGAGTLSSVLDNAPTYLNFLAASMAAHGADILQTADVKQYALGGFNNSILHLKAIAVASVFFGAMTYIGNGPNFMVKSIAEQLGVRMPSFVKYILYFSIPWLLPVFFLVWILCL
jgi:Na+/H+ antiporter NhaD/arsenite permease-like protein